MHTILEFALSKNWIKTIEKSVLVMRRKTSNLMKWASAAQKLSTAYLHQSQIQVQIKMFCYCCCFEWFWSPPCVMKSKQKETQCKDSMHSRWFFLLNTLLNFLISPHNLRTICIFVVDVVRVGRCYYYCCCSWFPFLSPFLNLFVVFHLDFVNLVLSGKHTSAFRIDIFCVRPCPAIFPFCLRKCLIVSEHDHCIDNNSIDVFFLFLCMCVCVFCAFAWCVNWVAAFALLCALSIIF